MPIKYSENGKIFVAHIAPGLSSEEAATAMGLAPGWQEITDNEAMELQRPTPEELAVTRLAEIAARLTAIDADSIRPLRAIAEGNGTSLDRQKLAMLEAEAKGLRKERESL